MPPRGTPSRGEGDIVWGDESRSPRRVQSVSRTKRCPHGSEPRAPKGPLGGQNNEVVLSLGKNPWFFPTGGKRFLPLRGDLFPSVSRLKNKRVCFEHLANAKLIQHVFFCLNSPPKKRKRRIVILLFSFLLFIRVEST